MTRHRLLLVLLALFWLPTATAAFAASKSPYQPTGLCGGLPRLQVTTAPGYCLGLVAEGFKFPRGLLVLPDGDLLVADMVGWGVKKGTVTRLHQKADGSLTRVQLASGLNMPHGLALGPDGKIYVGVTGGVKRFDPGDPKKTLEDVIGGAAAVSGPPGDGRHPLVSLIFTTRQTLLINIGSFTNNCETKGGGLPVADQPCPETLGKMPHGSVVEISFDWSSGKATGSHVFASGLRNSMGLIENPTTQQILQAENSRDDINDLMPGLPDDEDLPPDEINLLQDGAAYGWPYCYGANIPSPEYAHWDCSQYRKPLIELPAHGAPLGMAWFADGLVVGLHGYRSHGHRLIWFARDQHGLPIGPFKEMISGWGGDKNGPMGAPVDLKPSADGGLFISEDRNGTIVKLVKRP
jgi:glucose/arabinose dehydrogenase